MRLIYLCRLGVCVIVLAMPTVSFAALINGSFEISPPIPNGSSFLVVSGGSTDITGWTVTGSTIDVIGPTWSVSDGVQAIDLDGFNSTGGIQQTFSTVPGQKFTVSFDLSGNPEGNPIPKEVEVSVDGFLQTFSYDPTGQTRGTLIWEATSFEFLASGVSATLGFRSLTPGRNSWGALIDNVSVTGNPVPAPSALLLMATGLAGFMAWRWKKAPVA